jgi:hypothetical protein
MCSFLSAKAMDRDLFPSSLSLVIKSHADGQVLTKLPTVPPTGVYALCRLARLAFSRQKRLRRLGKLLKASKGVIWL